MPIRTYEIQAPDGSTLEIQSDHQPTRIEAQAAIRAMQSDVPTARARLATANATPLQEPTTFLGGAIKGWQSQAGPPVTAGDLWRDPSGSLSRMRGNLATDLTDPRIIGGALASYLVPKAVDAASEGVQNLRANYSDPIKDAIAQRFGFDPTAKDLAATRLRLQAAKSRTRVAKFERQQAEAANQPPPAESGGGRTPQPLILTPEQLQLHQQQMANAELLAKEQGMRSAAYGRDAWRNRQAVPQPASTLPVETSADAVPRGADAGAVPKSAAPPSSSSSPLEALQSAGLSADEAEHAVRWVRQGVDLDQVVKRIEATRALMRGKPGLQNLPTLREALNEVRSR